MQVFIYKYIFLYVWVNWKKTSKGFRDNSIKFAAHSEEKPSLFIRHQSHRLSNTTSQSITQCTEYKEEQEVVTFHVLLLSKLKIPEI